jgi:hypothetical protein
MKNPKVFLGAGISLMAIALLDARAVFPQAGAQNASRATQSVVQCDVTIRPVRGAEADVTTVVVHEQISGTPIAKAPPFGLRAPITYASVKGIAEAMENIELRDQTGAVPLKIKDDAVDPSGYPFYRHWLAQRSVVYPAVVTYRIRPRVSGFMGPQFALQSYAGGISTAGSGFLLLPEGLGTDNVVAHVHWDLSDLAPGAIGVATFGEGDFELQGSPDQLMQGFYMAGPLGRYPKQGTVNGFSGYWLGLPPFDPEKEMAWVSDCYAYLHTFFRDTTTSSYRVFFRVLPDISGNPGTALLNSFMLGTPVRGSGPLGTAPRESITHEMVHHWGLGLEGAPGEIAWFQEGTAVFYERLLPMRAGLFSVDSYGESINKTAHDYYSNPFHNYSIEALGHLGFSTGVGTGSAQNVAYTRGSLYLADVDSKIRTATGGQRKLDDILLALFDRMRRGENLDQNAWVDAIAKELGPSAREEFDSVIVRGENITPASGAFGPCFERRPTKFDVQGKVEKVDGFEWQRIPTVPEARCREW